MAELADSGSCLHLSAQEELLPGRRTDCVLGGESALGYYIFAISHGSYAVAAEGNVLAQVMDAMLPPLHRQAIGLVEPGSWNVVTITPQGRPQSPHRHWGLPGLRPGTTNEMLRDELVIA